MNTQPTPETESWCGWGIGGLQVVPASFSRKLERERDKAREQRDALAEALKEIYNVSSFDYATMPEPARKKYRQVVLEMADDALQSLTPNEL